MKIEFYDNADLSVDETIELYIRSTLGERRPVDRPDIFEGMLRNASLTITAWHDNRLVGIARTLTDFSFHEKPSLQEKPCYHNKGISTPRPSGYTQ